MTLATSRKMAETAAPPRKGRWTQFAISLAIGLVLWWAPVALAAVLLGSGHALVVVGLFFSKLAVVTFGGAYAVLAYMAQQAVEQHGWLSAPEMVDGLGLAETTPGPLILVLTYVGFLAAYGQSVGLLPLVGGLLGAVLVTWMTFVPCFLWIFLGAPYIEALRGRASLSAALSAITAAVVGVILNLAVWFGLHVVFATVAETRVAGLRLLVPEVATIDPVALVLAAPARADMEVYRPRHRAGEDLVALVEVALGPDGSVAIDGNTGALVMIGSTAAVAQALHGVVGPVMAEGQLHRVRA